MKTLMVEYHIKNSKNILFVLALNLMVKKKMMGKKAYKPSLLGEIKALKF